MNYKRLAFETHPINPGTPEATPPAMTAAGSGPRPGVSWMEEIEERIVMKAGNPPVWKKEAAPQAPKKEMFGTDLTGEEVDRIAAAFVRDLR
jgi:hypothetical protein